MPEKESTRRDLSVAFQAEGVFYFADFKHVFMNASVKGLIVGVGQDECRPKWGHSV